MIAPFFQTSFLQLRTFLILVPKNVLVNWKAEWSKWMRKSERFGPTIRTILNQPASQRLKIINHWHTAGGVLIMSYNMITLMYKNLLKAEEKAINRTGEYLCTHTRTLSWFVFISFKIDAKALLQRECSFWLVVDLEQSPKHPEFKTFTRCLLNPGPDIVVCDEGHQFKNPETQSFQVLNMMRTSRRLVLTGTPLQNNLNECELLSTWNI